MRVLFFLFLNVLCETDGHHDEYILGIFTFWWYGIRNLANCDSNIFSKVDFVGSHIAQVFVLPLLTIGYKEKCFLLTSHLLLVRATQSMPIIPLAIFQHRHDTPAKRYGKGI